MVNNLLANARHIGDVGSDPGLGISSAVGNGNPLQYYCLENPMDRVWWATVHGVAKSWTQLSMHALTELINNAVIVSGEQ